MTQPFMPQERRKELIRILKPWRTLEQLAEMTDAQLVQDYRALCQGDPHLEEGGKMAEPCPTPAHHYFTSEGICVYCKEAGRR